MNTRWNLFPENFESASTREIEEECSLFNRSLRLLILAHGEFHRPPDEIEKTAKAFVRAIVERRKVKHREYAERVEAAIERQIDAEPAGQAEE